MSEQGDKIIGSQRKIKNGLDRNAILLAIITSLQVVAVAYVSKHTLLPSEQLCDKIEAVNGLNQR